MRKVILAVMPSPHNIALFSMPVLLTRQMIRLSAKLYEQPTSYTKDFLIMRQKQPSEQSSQSPWLALFDGVYGRCTGWVRFLVKRDTRKLFQFAPLQSPLGQHLLATYNLPQENFSTFVVVTPDGYLTKSTAALNIMHHLGGMWRMWYVFVLVPKSLRDRVYGFIARYRYQLRGTLTTCHRPPQEYQDRFLYDV